MSDMKCPVCNKQMKIGTLDTDDGMGTVWMSIMPCDCVCSYGASKAVWQELITTRKALDLAITELKNVVEDDDFDIYMRQLSAQTTLEQINEITKGVK